MSVMKPLSRSSFESTRKMGGDWQKSTTGGSTSGKQKLFCQMFHSDKILRNFSPKTLMLKLHFRVFPDKSVAETTTGVVPILNLDDDVSAGTLRTFGL